MSKLFDKQLLAEWNPDNDLKSITEKALIKLKQINSFSFTEILKSCNLSALSRLFYGQQQLDGDQSLNFLSQSVYKFLLSKGISSAVSQSFIQSQWKVKSSPNGQFLALSMDDRVLIWNQVTDSDFEIILEKDDQRELSRVAWSQDSRFFVISQSNKRVDVIDVNYNELVFSIIPADRKKFNFVSSIIVLNAEHLGRAVLNGHRFQYELLIIYSDGQIGSYLFRQLDKGIFGPLFQKIDQTQQDFDKDIVFNFDLELKWFDYVICVSYIADIKMLIFGGQYQNKEQICLCRVISKDPHLKYVGSQSNVNQPGQSSFFRHYFTQSVTAQNSAIVSALNSIGNNIVSVSSNNSINIFQLTEGSQDINQDLKQVIKITDIMNETDVADDLQILYAQFYNERQVLVFLSSGMAYLLQLPDLEVLQSFDFSDLDSFCIDLQTSTQQLNILAMNILQKHFTVRQFNDMVDVKILQSSKQEQVSVWSQLKQEFMGPFATVFNAITGIKLIDTVSQEKIISLGLRQFKFYQINETTALQLLESKLKAQLFDEALSVAKTYGLELDLVYKEWWLKSEVSIQNIKQILSKVQDKEWKIAQSLSSTAKSFEDQKALIQFGINQTNILPQLVQNESQDEWNEKLQGNKLTTTQIKFSQMRTQLLKVLDKLSTLEEIYVQIVSKLNRKIPFEVVFKTFQRINISDFACWCAERSLFEPIKVLFKRHKLELRQHLNRIVSHLPETLPFGQYLELVNISNSQFQSFRDQDWVECETIMKQLNFKKAHDYVIQDENNVDLNLIALKVEHLTGLVDQSYQEFDDDKNYVNQLLQDFIYDCTWLHTGQNIQSCTPDQCLKLKYSQILDMPKSSILSLIQQRGIQILQLTKDPSAYFNDLQSYLLPLFQEDELQNCHESILKLCNLSVKTSESVLRYLKNQKVIANKFKELPQSIIECSLSSEVKLSEDWIILLTEVVDGLIQVPFDKARTQVIKLLLNIKLNLKSKKYLEASQEIQNLTLFKFEWKDLKTFLLDVTIQLVRDKNFKDHEEKNKLLYMMMNQTDVNDLDQIDQILLESTKLSANSSQIKTNAISLQKLFQINNQSNSNIIKKFVNQV